MEFEDSNDQTVSTQFWIQQGGHHKTGFNMDVTDVTDVELKRGVAVAESH